MKAFLYHADQRTELNPNEVPVQDQVSLNHLDYQVLLQDQHVMKMRIQKNGSSLRVPVISSMVSSGRF
ncbi:hypothetical protein AAG906_014270 [Vitis piasezkii]